ncbi:hypothetical protein [Actinomadura nitritigenes]|uniref:hypothetical protein n=1 Tax=Actinomadura nitritigenes TaxID=134602 RepID=UPI003D8BF872
MPDGPRTERRTLLGAAGLLAAAASLPDLTAAPEARAGSDALDEWTLDTMKGLAVFVMPGPDAHSRAQGTPRKEPGGIEARLPEFLVHHLNRYLPFPDLPAAALAGALGPPPHGAPALRSDAVIPLAPAVALILNAQAVRVDPRTLGGPFLAPFSRLPYSGKARVFELLEGPDPALVQALDAHLAEPLKRSASGLLKYAAGALLELSALGGYSEWGVLDPATRRPRARPVGWRVSGYTPASAGRPEFRGYYQGRRKATG